VQREGTNDLKQYGLSFDEQAMAPRVLVLARKLDKNVSTVEELFSDLESLSTVKREEVAEDTVCTSEHDRSIHESVPGLAVCCQ